MKQILITIGIICWGMIQASQEISHEIVYNRFVIVIVSFNNINFYQGNLDSVLMQDYPRDCFRVLYRDDCSTDGTFCAVETYIQEHDAAQIITLSQSPHRQCALANQYELCSSVDDREIIVILDGDDQLFDSEVLKYLNTIYQDPSVWITYGQYLSEPEGTIGYCCPMPRWVVERNGFRDFEHNPSHIRTFRGALFKKINQIHLKDKQGNFFTMSSDVAIMMPMMEMARLGHFRFIPKVLYRYNNANPLSDHRISRNLQYDIDRYIRSLPRYEALTELYQTSAA